MGRVPELELLTRALGDAAEGFGSVTFVEGIAGIGKTRLLDEALERAEIETRRAASRELEQGRPFGVFIDALDLDPSDLHLGTSEDVLGPHQTFAAIDEVLESIERLGIRGPVALVLEDLHWIDEPSCAVLDRLVPLTRELPIAIICNLRPEPAPAALQVVRENAARNAATTLTLQALATDERSAFVREILGGEPGPRLERTLDGASGNPLFIEEILSSLLEEKSVSKRQGVVDTEVDIAPTSFRLAILRRFSSLPEGSLALLRVGAALGGTFTIADLTSASDVSVEGSLQLLRAPVAGGLLSGEESTFTFTHDLVRDAIYYDSPEPVRAAMHREIARRLAAAGAPVEQIAEQAYRGAVPGDDECIGWLREAGRSRASDSPVAAIRFLTRAYDLTMSPASRAHIQAELVRPLMWSSRLEEATSAARAALAVIDEPGERASLMTDLGHVMYLQDDYQGGFAEMKRAALIPGLDERDRARRLAAWASTANEYSEDIEEAGREALRIAEDAGDLSTQAIALAALCKLARGRDDLQRSFELGERACAKARLSGDPVALATVAIKFAPALFHSDRFSEHVSLMEEAMAAAERTGSSWMMPQLVAMRSASFMFTGAWDEAIDGLEGSIRLGTSTKVLAEEASVASHLSMLHVRRGDLRRAQEFLDMIRADDLAEDNVGQYRWARMLFARAKGDSKAAVEHARIVFDIHVRLWGAAVPLAAFDLVPLFVETGELELAKRFTARVEEMADKTGWVYAQAIALRCKGLIEGDPEPIATAAEMLAGTERKPLEADARLDAGRLFITTGQPDKAGPHLLRAIDLYEFLRAEPGLRDSRALLRQIGIRSGTKGARRRPTTGFESLTPSEDSVAQLVAEGLTNAEIAERLFVSRKTVETHLSRVFRKLDARSRVDVAKQVLARSGGGVIDEAPKDP